MNEIASLASVLSEIAVTASETLELRQVFDRIGTSVRRVIPFDHMGVVRILNQHAVEHATTLAACPMSTWDDPSSHAEPAATEAPSCMEPRPLANWSPPGPGQGEQIEGCAPARDHPGTALFAAGEVRDRSGRLNAHPKVQSRRETEIACRPH